MGTEDLCLGATDHRSELGGMISESCGKISVVTTAILARLTSASFVHELGGIVIALIHALGQAA